MSYFSKRYHPPGTTPGTLIPVPREHAVPLKLRLFSYTKDGLHEHVLANVTECQPLLTKKGSHWLRINGHPDPETLTELGKLFGVHPLSLEDVMNAGQRPKLDAYDDYLFAIAEHARIGEEGAYTEQVSLFLGANWVISVYFDSIDPFDPIEQRLRNGGALLRSRDSDYLFYTLLDVVIDAGFPLLEYFGETLETLEDLLLEQPQRETIHELHHLRRELLILRRNLWPHREVINNLIRDETGRIGDNVKFYLRDCYDHTIQVLELLESYREMTAGMLDLYLSSLSYRLNDVMRLLTIIATIFMPLTFIAGIYGMNFGSNSESFWAMPELRWAYGYPFALGLMAAVAISMLIFFRRKNWI